MQRASGHLRAKATRWLWSGLVVAGLGFASWVWWHSGKTAKPAAAPPSTPTRTGTTAPTQATVTLPPGIHSNRTLITGRANLPSTTAPAPIITNPPSLQAATNPPRRSGVTGVQYSQELLEAQLALVRAGISPGSLDGVMGLQTRSALRAFQQREALSVTGDLDDATRPRLLWNAPALTNYVVTSEDVGRMLPLGKTWLAKSQQERLDFETILELVAEKNQSSPKLIRRLNPGLDWSNVLAGTFVTIPNVELPPATEKAAFMRILLAERILQVFGADSNLLAHFPCSIAQRVDKRPVGELHVAVIAPNPNYTFDPEVFPESAEARELGRKLILQPGPNNPVGVLWIGLDKPGYGIHGTPRPEDVGRTESHGCFRLANWNADYLLKLVWVGLPVSVEP